MTKNFGIIWRRRVYFSANARISRSSVMGPAVSFKLEVFGIKTEQVVGTGPKNNILKGDVLEHISRLNLKPTKTQVLTVDRPIINRRKLSKGRIILSDDILQSLRYFLEGRGKTDMLDKMILLSILGAFAKVYPPSLWAAFQQDSSEYLYSLLGHPLSRAIPNHPNDPLFLAISFDQKLSLDAKVHIVINRDLMRYTVDIEYPENSLDLDAIETYLLECVQDPTLNLL